MSRLGTARAICIQIGSRLAATAPPLFFQTEGRKWGEELPQRQSGRHTGVAQPATKFRHGCQLLSLQENILSERPQRKKIFRGGGGTVRLPALLTVHFWGQLNFLGLATWMVSQMISDHRRKDATPAQSRPALDLSPSCGSVG